MDFEGMKNQLLLDARRRNYNEFVTNQSHYVDLTYDLNPEIMPFVVVYTLTLRNHPWDEGVTNLTYSTEDLEAIDPVYEDLKSQLDVWLDINDPVQEEE